MSPIINVIRKRSGEVASFDIEKITSAVRKAFLAVTGDVHEEESLKVTEEIVSKMQSITDSSNDDVVIGVESIQDMVELAIMDTGYHAVAKAYIIYRFEHTKKRQKEKEEVKERIEEHKLFVKKRDGRTELFSVDKIKKSIERAATGLEAVNVDSLVRQIELEVHDGISTEDVAHTLVLVTRSFIERDPAYSQLASRLLLEGLIYRDALGKISDSTDFKVQYRNSFKNKIKEAVHSKLVDEKLLTYDLERIASAIEPQQDNLLRYLGTETLSDRYLVKDKSDSNNIKFLETPQFMWMRVAMGLSLNERDREDTAIKFYKILSSLRFLSSTPTLFHSGTLYPQLSSCFLGVADDTMESIFNTYKDCANLSKHAGGVAWSWSKLRASGALVKKTGVESNGVVPFLKIADSVTIAINRSGRRRGATCVYLETWHLDIEDFLELRKNTGDDRRRTHEMNTSNWIPDLFMKRVRENAEWTLFSPDETPELPETYGKEFERIYEGYEEKAKKGEIRLFKVLKARDLWRRMITQLYETGHPWITFKDPSNIRSPQDHVGVIHSSNLCTEITLPTIPDQETAVCNLGSVNLSKHVKNGVLDEKMIRETVMTGMHMLDNVIDINFYPTEAARTSNMRHRPVGLGIMGFQDALYLLDIDFESEEAVLFADKSMEIISYYAILTSSILAKNRGAYETYKGSKWDRGILPVDTLDLLEEERGEEIPVDKDESMDWGVIRESIRKYGMRNSNCMALAPTATISNIAGCFPTIEPIYKNIYVKANISGEFIVTNDYLINDLKKEGLWNGEMLELIKGQEGVLNNISLIPEKIKTKYKEVFDINPRWLIKIAAHRGKWIDQSQSLNIFYKGTSGSELSEIYNYAWEMGLKTTYYLRTLAASSVEKSTVSLARQNIKSSVDSKISNSNIGVSVEQMVAQVREEVQIEARSKNIVQDAEMEISSNTQMETKIEDAVTSSPPSDSKESVRVGFHSSGVKLCKLDDPDCESCQ